MGTKYTYTFEREDERKFREVLSRLDESEYIIHEDIHEIEDPKHDKREWKMGCVIEMEPDACLTFRLGMKFVVIRRERSDEELAAEAALEAKNTIKIRVQVPMADPGTP